LYSGFTLFLEKNLRMNSFNLQNRRAFIRNMTLASGLLIVPGTSMEEMFSPRKIRMRLGLVTYLWGKDWNNDTLIKNLSQSGIYGVELRVEHAHGVSPSLSKAERKEVRKKYKDGGIEIVGMGTNQQYDFPDGNKLYESIEKTKEYILLSRDIGGSGVKVKPNQFHPNVPKSRTIEQIGRSLRQLAVFGADYGQQIRLEVHGNETQEIENIKAIMDVADHPNATVCWNCNPEDLKGNGLEYNFNLLKDRFGDICHVRELDEQSYPYQSLMNLFVQMNYKGWILLECRTDPSDKVAALINQRKVFEGMLGKAKTS
jgi:sugar phosphate isomerase/epimerase